MTISLVRSTLASMATLAFLLALTPSAQAIGIRPIRSEFSLQPGESITGEITVLNETSTDFDAEPVIKVFYKNDETGFPVYPHPDEEREIENFQDWIILSKDPVSVPAKGSATVQYTVNVPTDAQAGGKYATIAYQPIIASQGGIAVNVRAASLLFVNVEGEVFEEGKLTRFELPPTLKTNEPLALEVTFENTGNTHVKPYGWIEIKDKTSGKTLTRLASYLDPKSNQEVEGDEIPVNLRQKNVLPASTRTFQAQWMNHLQEGNFEAVVNLKYGREAKLLSQTLDFEVKEEMTVEEFSIDTKEKATGFKVVLSNQGKAYEKPLGEIKITNALGYKVSEILLPEEMNFIAPGERVELNLPWLDKMIPKGRYTATLEASYGFTQKELRQELHFGEADRALLFMGLGLGGAILVALAALFWRRKR